MKNKQNEQFLSQNKFTLRFSRTSNKQKASLNLDKQFKSLLTAKNIICDIKIQSKIYNRNRQFFKIKSIQANFQPPEATNV